MEGLAFPRSRDKGFCQVWGCMPETPVLRRLGQNKEICKVIEQIFS